MSKSTQDFASVGRAFVEVSRAASISMARLTLAMMPEAERAGSATQATLARLEAERDHSA